MLCAQKPTNHNPSSSLHRGTRKHFQVGCVPTACVDCMCFNSHQMSALLVGGGFEWVFIDGHQMSVARESLHSEVPCLVGGGGGLGPGGPCTKRSHVWRRGQGWRPGERRRSLYSEVPCVEGEGTLYSEVQ